MKNTITVLLSAFILLICNLTFNIDDCICQWQTDVRLTNAPDSSRTGNSGLASNGNFVHFVWMDKRDGNFEIYYKRSTDAGVTWGTDTRLTNNPAISFVPSCAVNGSVVHVVWNDNRSGTYQVYYKRSTDAGITWSADTLLTNATPPLSPGYFWPQLSLSGSLMIIVWYEYRDGNNEVYCKRSTNGGISWGADTRLTNDPAYSNIPNVSMSGTNIHIVWSDNRDGNFEIYYKHSTDGGISWSADTRLTNDVAYSLAPSVAISGTNVHVVWVDSRDGNYEIYYKRSTDGGVSWGADTRLTNDPATANSPLVAVSGSNLHIVWYDNRDGNYETYYKLSTNSGVNWGVDTRLTIDPASSIRPLITISNSVVHVVWTDERDGNMEIYYKRNPAGNPTGIVSVNTEIPKEYKLMQNYPNPFNPMTNVKFSMLNAGNVKIIVYDVTGKEVATLVNDRLEPGTYEVTFDGSKLSSGIYFYKLISGDFVDTKKLVLSK